MRPIEIRSTRLLGQNLAEPLSQKAMSPLATAEPAAVR